MESVKPLSNPHEDENLVVVLTITHKPILTRYEEISITQCTKILKKYPRIFIVPKGMNVEYYSIHFPTWELHFVHPYWLSSYKRSNRLKISPKLFNAFKKFQFILFHEPDAFVFSDQLTYWCHRGYSYIGAPWFEGKNNVTEKAKLIGVGNSGLSLRKVEDHIRATDIWKPFLKWSDLEWYIKPDQSSVLQFCKFLFRVSIGNTTWWYLNNFRWNEDYFWSFFINRLFDWFTIPPPEIAMKFSFEVLPNRLYQENNYQLPFGCHAWWRYDLNFWKPHIEKYGHKFD